MVNFRDPAVMDRDYMALKTFWILVDGFFIWEFLITLDYEWGVIQGRRPCRWTIWVYSLTRVATLATVALNLFSLDATNPINCQVTIISQFIFAYLALAASSLLIVLRVIAIWEKNRAIVAIATGIWGTNILFLIHGVSRFRSSWGEDKYCVVRLGSIRLSTIVALVTDVILLLIMLLGLSRLRRRCNGGMMALGRLLWNQGVAWLLLAVTAELTPTVFICLDLNEPFNLMFQIPWVITMSIAATRMHRSLSDLLSPDIRRDSSQEILQTSGRTAFLTNSTSASPVLLTGIQVAVHTTHELLSTPQATRFGPSMGWEPHNKPSGLNEGDGHVESSAEE